MSDKLFDALNELVAHLAKKEDVDGLLILQRVSGAMREQTTEIRRMVQDARAAAHIVIKDQRKEFRMGSSATIGVPEGPTGPSSGGCDIDP